MVMDGDGVMEGALAMGLSGFTVAVLVPGIIRATRSRPVWSRVCLPASVALPLFLLVHAAATLTPLFHGAATPAVHWILEAALVGSGFLFWLPVFGGRYRLSEPGRCLYLFLASPLLDLPALLVIASGHALGGLSMIVGMLPIGVAAMAVTWRWATAEDQRAT
ncbi:MULTISPECIES: cytochrome c oxidase assembly protein [Streptomyces]|uniref:cytochrome c oxidase assembly protein n=1 Tax=Streptomyces lycopersici TaxID=2974589 RepID=UPI0021D1C32C|nr:cytochrome c oxidase assembly protein [Streptomyces sp. NEAU-383]